MNPLRKAIQKFGFDFHRYSTKADKIDYLKNLEIKTVLDIGANVGQFAGEIRNILPEAFIYSFEPLEECFEKLGNARSGDKKFQAFQFALGEKDENVEMEKNEYSPSSSILPLSSNHKEMFPHAKKTEPEKISIKRLDDIAHTLVLTKEILIKVDVQGFEDKVIRGGTDTFKKARAVIMETSFIELYAGQQLFDSLYKTLTTLGFTYTGALQEKVNKKTGQIISEDSLFLKIKTT